MAEDKSSLIRYDDMPKSITLKKIEWFELFAWTHAVKVYLHGKKKLKYLTDQPPDVKGSITMIG